jgi:hypothetical protein
LVPTKIETLGVEFSAGQQVNFRYIVGSVVVYLVLAFTKEIVVQVYNARKHKSAIEDLAKYRRIYASVLSVSQMDRSKMLYDGMIEGFSVLMVDYFIPYYIAFFGLTACFHLLPDRFYDF